VSFLDRLYAGKVMMQSTVLTDTRFLTNRSKTYLLVASRRGTFRLVLKEVETSWGIPCSVRYATIPGTAITEMRKEFTSMASWFDEAEALLGVENTRESSSSRMTG